MSSATRPDPDAARRSFYASPMDAEMKESQRGPGGGLDDRQFYLNHLWSFYTCQCYANRRVDWDGKENLEHLEHEVVATSGAIPPGFFDSGQTFPLKFRKPTTPYYLVRVIVNRFTGLLFSKKRSPKLLVRDDPRTEDWVGAFAAATRLWSRMIMARTYGGAMGSVGIGFKFVGGRPVVEVHDPRWSKPKFKDTDSGELRELEKRYMYPDATVDRKTGAVVQGDFWYRRVIDEEEDVVWPRVPVEKGVEPDWEDPRYRVIRTVHGFGFVPVVWIQNHEVQGSEDGWSDAEGIYDMVEGIDRLHAQAFRGIVANCDPTLVVASDNEGFEDGVRKGSDNALWTERGGGATYLEISGTGPTVAMNLAAKLREHALEVAQCVLDTNFAGPARSEQEVSANYSSMLETADKLREQYGVGIQRFFELVLRAVRKMEMPSAVEAEPGRVEVVSRRVELPPRVEKSGGGVQKFEREVGEGELVELQWPAYAEPSRSDAAAAVSTAASAKTGGLVDVQTAVRYVASFFQIEDVQGMVDKVEEESAKRQEEFASRVAAVAKPGGFQAAVPPGAPPVQLVRGGKP